VNRKEVSLAIVTFAAGLTNAYLWKGALFEGEFRNAAFYSLPVVSLFVLAILFALSSAFLKTAALRGGTAVLAAASPYLLIPYSTTALSGAALSGLAGWYAASAIANEYAVSNSFSARKILRGGLPVFFTAVALMLAVFYFTAVSGENSSLFFPKTLFDTAVKLFQEPLQGILPGFRSDASVDQLLLAFAAQQAGADIDVSSLPPAERERLMAEGRTALAEQFGIALTGREKAGDVLYRLTNAQIEKFVGPYRAYLPFLAAFGFFVAVKAFTLPVYWTSLILVWAVVRLLVMLTVLTEKIETIEIRRLTL